VRDISKASFGQQPGQQTPEIPINDPAVTKRPEPLWCRGIEPVSERMRAWLECVYCAGLIPGYLAVAVIGYLLLIPIFVLAQIPYPPFQSFVLLNLLHPFLQYNASELRAYVEDDSEAANMRRKIACAA
jgi:hypothetical protein